jgi:ferritin-like protein
MAEKIFPRNLTARAAVTIAGNPVTTRLESAVGNCYPGLEFDHRNLDRRFFPGLVFNFGGTLPVVLAAIEPTDPALEPQPGDDDATAKAIPALSAALRDQFKLLGRKPGDWILAAIAQGGRSIDTATAGPYDDGMQIWRLVRSLERDQVTITLRLAADASPGPGGKGARVIRLTHFRRRYVDPDKGVLSPVYLPGELTQSMCSPWQHDFRDCACDYWASNHPDIVLGEDLPRGAELPSGIPLDDAAPLDWLRADRASRVAASRSDAENDALRLRHYQINSEWQTLAFVLGGKEISGVYAPRDETFAQPFASHDELAAELARLCGLELAVMLEYLYAYFSLRDPGEAGLPRGLGDALTFARHEILGIAIGEMRHLRWANQLLWSLEKLGSAAKLGPILTPGPTVPDPSAPNGQRPRALLTLQPEVLDRFIAVEQPSGTLDGEYSRVVSTLRSGFSPALLQLARQIVADGMEHYSRFREIKVALTPFFPKRAGAQPVYLRPLQIATASEARAALTLFTGILNDLGAAYRRGDMEDARNIVQARTKMIGLEDEASALAAKNLGVPFFSGAVFPAGE